MQKRNIEIREAAKENRVCLWQVGERIGKNDASFSRLLRQEVDPTTKLLLLGIIDDLAQEQKEVAQ
jgi:hypothetical protein